MTSTVRILTAADESEYRKFIQLNDNSASVKPLQFGITFLSKSNANAAIAAEIVDGRITTCFLGYSPDVAWGTKTKVCPFWIAGHYKSIVKCAPSQIKKKTETLGALLFDFFERRKYYSFYMCRFVPTKLTFDNCEEYQSNVALRALSISRYRPTVEELLSNSSNFDSLPQLYKLMTFDFCPPEKKIAIIRYDLKPEHRI